MNSETPWPIIDVPHPHGMFMLGTTTLYLCHMPMFTSENHYYQLTLQVHLDAASMAVYLADKARNPGQPYNLTNLDSDLFTLPDVVSGTMTTYAVSIFRGYSNADGGTPDHEIVARAIVTVDRVVYFRAFDQGIARPRELSYVLFGDGKEAHLDHYIAAAPDFQHLLTLPQVPAWLATTQLQAGVVIAFAGKASTPTPPCSSPIEAGSYEVLFQGLSNARVMLDVGSTFWFSTGNGLNAQDPCLAGGASEPPKSHHGMK